MFATYTRPDGGTTSDNKSPKAFVAIYLQEQKETTPKEMELIVQRMERFAESHALAVTETFIEPLNTRPHAVAHRAMVTSLRGRRKRYLIIPGVHHFANLGKNPLAVLGDLKAFDVEVLIAGHVE
ncbi:hypothetical protein JOF29_003558 [Kribbella aluminosa]|uniref:Resolvase/invertase-type recombinase catalytic domain-containing protein n=2 Tax=Kribbella aluminosa TaxID=416017 RepID=A0ABS4ULG3_9ACTN|nr:hypothetical protein [Kribbella aluminosa]